MKKIGIYILLCTITLGISAQPLKPPVKVKWYTIEQAMELQKTSPRKIMIDVFTDWCGWCKKMDAETFNNPVIAEYLNAHYYPVKFNAESRESVTFAGKTFINEGNGTRSSHQFAIALLQGNMSYPSIAYLDEKSQLLTAIPGYFNAKDYEPLINFIAEDRYKTSQTLEEYKKTFQGKVK